MTPQEAKILTLTKLKTVMPWSTKVDMQFNVEDFLTEDDIQSLILNLAFSRGDQGFMENELDEVLKEVAWVKMMNSMVGLALKGVLYIDVNMEKDPTNRVSYKAATEYLEKMRRSAAAHP